MQLTATGVVVSPPKPALPLLPGVLGAPRLGDLADA